MYIYNGIIFPSLNHAKLFDSISDEHNEQVVIQLGKSRGQWFTSNKVKGARKLKKIEFIAFLREFYKGS